MKLADNIRRYFFANFDKLPQNRQFHFASRLAAWEGSKEATDKLRELKPLILPTDADQMFKDLLNYPLGPIYADQYRRKYFQKYPKLHGINMCLFQIRHLKEIYGLDLRHHFLNFVNHEELAQSANDILHDTPALKFLSSFAVNHIYLLQKLYGISTDLDPELFFKMHSKYDKANPAQFNLLVYLLTHCVIAESNYYSEGLPANKLEAYLQMMELLDRLVAGRSDVKLDALLEYLVASRICGRVAPAQRRVHAQLSNQLSDDGTYIIDLQNYSSGIDINSLNVSEHRNALYIMSTSSFRPHKVRID